MNCAYSLEMSDNPFSDTPPAHLNASQDADKEEPYFTAVLTPSRSLGPLGFGILMAAIGVVSFVAGIFFWSVGAWPVFGFFGLDFLIIYVGFRLNYRSGLVRERLEIRDGQFHVVRTDPSTIWNKGTEIRWETNAYWARVNLVRLRGGASRLEITSHGKSCEIGAFFGDDERTAFAGELRSVLETYRENGAHRHSV